MRATDLGAVDRIARSVHPSLPERPEVLAEKLSLFPQGCFAFESKGEVIGYAISHPWILHSVPPLDAYLGALPATPDCLYLHDLAVLSQGRGKMAASRLIAELRAVATRAGLPALALASVYGTTPMWSRVCFSEVGGADPSDKLATYGATAKYMIAPV